MAQFRYRAMTQSGTMVRGLAEATSEAELVQNLRGRGHYPLSTIQTKATWATRLAQTLRPRPRISARSLAMATQELASLLQAGLELDHALGILVNLSGIGALRGPFETVRARVRDGATLADALDEQSVFSKFYVSMVRAGEHGGNLETTLHRLSDYLTRTLAIREAIGSALIYPAILLVSAGLSIVVILTVVLPEFKPLFAQAGKSLPWPTRIVMDIGDAVQASWWALLLVIGGVAVWFRQALKRPEFQMARDRLVLRVPVLGRLLTDIDAERFSRTLGTLLCNGVPLPTALSLVKNTLSNSTIAKAVADTATSLREGDSVAGRLAQDKIFSAVTLDLIRVGEETGKLDEMLLRQADLDEQRIRHTVDRLLALLVPALTVILGLIVGGLIASLLVAILGVDNLALQ